MGYASLGSLAQETNDPAWAERSFAQALSIMAEGSRPSRLVAAASRLEESVDPIRDPDFITEQNEVLEAVRESVGADDFDVAWNEERSMSLAEAVECALASID